MSGAEQPISPKRASYHHGRLREAMIEAAVALIEEVGPYAVTVREVARRAGVSPGAPFRHFPTRAALLTAVAEEAMRRFQAEIAAALGPAAEADVRERLRIVGQAYLAWATRNPTHFKVISNRDLIDYANSSTLMGINAQTQALLAGLFGEAAAAGRLRDPDIDRNILASRALVYGLARMAADGHLPQGGAASENERRMQAAFDLFLAGVFRD
jgi:AcrR family transcriptional regulator